MQIFSKMSKVILFLFCLLLSFQIVFAQDISALKADIYSKIGCITCKDMTIDKCNCPKSKEMKAYIDALLETGVQREEIFYKVAKKFSLRAIMDKQISADLEKRFIKEAKGKLPKAVMETTSFNLGRLSKRQGKVFHLFKLRNEGNAPLLVKNLKTSCSCVSVAIKLDKDKSAYFGTNGAGDNWKVEIKPDKSAEIEVVIDLSHKTVGIGKLIREVYVSTNDVLNSEITLMLDAEVIK